MSTELAKRRTAPKHPNTEHDEAYNRATWRGEAWLGVESFHGPKHLPPRDVTGKGCGAGFRLIEAEGIDTDGKRPLH